MRFPAHFSFLPTHLPPLNFGMVSQLFEAVTLDVKYESWFAAISTKQPA